MPTPTKRTRLTKQQASGEISQQTTVENTEHTTNNENPDNPTLSTPTRDEPSPENPFFVFSKSFLKSQSSDDYVIDEEAFKTSLTAHIKSLADKYKINNYTILFLHDGTDEISAWHANRIYKAAAAGNKKKPILLLIYSRGGSIEPAYLISKTCKKLSNDKFAVAIPRKAKSAATLISLGADEIHMGLMSELGPIDPQIGGYPALGIKNALEILSELSCKHPGASQMIGEYLNKKLDLRILGYFERINESAMQYAERLLQGKPIPSSTSAKKLADHFVNHYKDHSFVIDYDEAHSLLGGNLVKQETIEYAFANAVYESLDLFKILMGISGEKSFDYVGGIDDIRVFTTRKNE